MRAATSLLLCEVLVVVSCSQPAQRASAGRPAAWAAPIEAAGLPNLHRVNNGLYRAAQPSADGVPELKRLGVRTVVNLRGFHSDRDELAGSGLNYEHIRMNAWHAEEEDVVRFLRIATDPAKRPVLVHCQHGADRTGLVCAAYRIAVEGWSREDAIREMTEGGFGYHEVWDNLLAWLRAMDVDRVRREAGISR